MDLQKPGLRCSGFSCYLVFGLSGFQPLVWIFAVGLDFSADGLGLLSVGSSSGCGCLDVAWGSRCGRLGGKRPRASGCCLFLGRCLVVVWRVFGRQIAGVRCLGMCSGEGSLGPRVASAGAWQGRRALGESMDAAGESGSDVQGRTSEQALRVTCVQCRLSDKCSASGPTGEALLCPAHGPPEFVQFSCHRVTVPPKPWPPTPRQRPHPCSSRRRHVVCVPSLPRARPSRRRWTLQVTLRLP